VVAEITVSSSTNVGVVVIVAVVVNNVVTVVKIHRSLFKFFDCVKQKEFSVKVCGKR
jgi:hypothetical protein